MGTESDHKKTTQRENEVWRRAFNRLVAWTVTRHRVTPADAEEMVQEAVAQLIRAGGVIDLEEFGELLRAIGSRINGIAVNLRRKKALLAVQLNLEGSFDEHGAAYDGEERLVDRDVARRAVNAVLEGLRDDELAFSIIALMAEQIYEPAEQARKIGRVVTEIYNARRRLVEHVKVVRKLMETW